jgi:hypothetical protein
VPDLIENPTDESVKNKIEELGFELCSTKGIDGEFYTVNRLQDLKLVCLDIINEKDSYR